MQSFVHPTAIIYPGVHVEDGAYIGPYCIVGAPPEHRRYSGNGRGVVIRSGAKLTGLVTVDAGTEAQTYIGPDSLLMKHSHVGHDAVIGSSCTIACGAKIGGHTLLENHVNIALNASVHQGVTIPEGVMLGMNSCITKKTKLQAYKIYAGTPARFIKENTVLKQRLGL